MLNVHIRQATCEAVIHFAHFSKDLKLQGLLITSKITSWRLGVGWDAKIIRDHLLLEISSL